MMRGGAGGMSRGGVSGAGSWGTGFGAAQKRPYQDDTQMAGAYGVKKPATTAAYVGMGSTMNTGTQDMYGGDNGMGDTGNYGYGGDMQQTTGYDTTQTSGYATGGTDTSGYSNTGYTSIDTSSAMGTGSYSDKTSTYSTTPNTNFGATKTSFSGTGDGSGGYSSGVSMSDMSFSGGYGNSGFSNANYKSFDMQQESSTDFTDDNVVYEQSYGSFSRGGQGGGQGRGGGGGGRGRGRGGTRGGMWGPVAPWGPRGGFGGGGFGGPRGGGRFHRGGRGRGKKVPPVHSMSKVLDCDPSTMSVAEKIRRFCLFLQNDAKKVNAIQTIENGLTGCKLGLKTEYNVQELMRLSGKPMYTGEIQLSGVFMVRSVGANKKEVKHDVYQKCLDILTTKSVAEIFNLKDPGIDAIRLELQNSMDQKKTVPTGSDKLAQEALSSVTAKLTTNLKSGLEKVVAHIKEAKNLPENVISAVEQAITSSHCDLKHKYEVDEMRMPNGKFFFRGSLKFEDTVIARGKGFKKKDTKSNTYANGLESLKTKSIDDLMEGIKQEIEPEMQTFDGKVIPNPGSKDLPLNVKFEELIKQLSAMPYKENNINIIDQTAMQLGLTPTCVYRKLEKAMLTCELYLDSILITSGEGEKRKESQIEAYNKAWEVLTTSDAKTIVNEHKRLSTDESAMDSNICDVWVKGSGRHGESNIAGLRRYRFDPNEGNKTVDQLVIMEHPDWAFDRKRHAFCILQYSATLNGMLLQWHIEGNAQNFKCTIHLQKEFIGESYGMSKSAARNLAAADALFKLYETHNVVLITKIDDSKAWIKWSTIEEMSESIRKASGEKPFVAEVDEDGKAKANKFIVKAVDIKLEEFAKRYVLEELIFGPGMQLAESKEIRNLAKEKNLRYDIRQHQGQMYLVIYTRMSPKEMAECLKSCGGKSGKYSLTNKDDLPKHGDVVEYLKTATSSVMMANKPKDAEIDFKQDVDFSF